MSVAAARDFWPVLLLRKRSPLGAEGQQGDATEASDRTTASAYVQIHARRKVNGVTVSTKWRNFTNDQLYGFADAFISALQVGQYS